MPEITTPRPDRTIQISWPLSAVRSIVLVALLALLPTMLPPRDAQAAAGSIMFEDINPDIDDSGGANSATGGRVHNLGMVSGNNAVVYAANEFGGLFKTTNGMVSWTRVDSVVPTMVWDVAVDPSNANRVVAATQYDGKVVTLAGIIVSNDAGLSWVHPPSASPPAGFSCVNPLDEPSAYGIAFMAGAPQRIFVGTSCGLAISSNGGATWTFVNPTIAPVQADDVYDVIVQPGGPNGTGIIDTYGDLGHFRSVNNGATWTGGSGTPPNGNGTLTVSPDESYVLLLAANDKNIYESDNGGATWTLLGTPDRRHFSRGSGPMVKVNNRAGTAFDLWFGGVGLYRGSCVTPAVPAPGGAQRCPDGRKIPDPLPGDPPPAGWAGTFTTPFGGHDDIGEIEFDTTVAVDSCPLYFTSDGGAHTNTDLGADCQNPNWAETNVGMHGLWLFAMDAVHQPGVGSEELYLGTMDDGTFGSVDGGAAAPTWHVADCCDAYDIAAQVGRMLYRFCCGSRLMRTDPGALNPVQIEMPPGQFANSNFVESLDDFADKQFIAGTVDSSPPMTDTGGAFTTNDVTASPVVWTQLGASSTPAGGFCVMKVALTGTVPTFFAVPPTGSTSCDESPRISDGNTPPSNDPVYRWNGAIWQRIDFGVGGPGQSGVRIFNVDRTNPNRLAAFAVDGTFWMTADGGTTWTPNPGLDALTNGFGAFKRRVPTFIAFDPEDPNLIITGASEAGLFLSTNGGANWLLISDPYTPHLTGIPHFPEPRYAFFDHEPGEDVRLYLGTRGRGGWRITLPTQDLAVTKSCFSRPPTGFNRAPI